MSDDTTLLTPLRPHLFRAFYDWIIENDLTPFIAVDVTLPDVQVPTEHAQDGVIILNLSLHSTEGFLMDMEKITFSARFGGISTPLEIPFYALQFLYARENDSIMLQFQPERCYELQLKEFHNKQNKKSLFKPTLLEEGDSETDKTIEKDLPSKGAEKSTTKKTTKKPALRLISD